MVFLCALFACAGAAAQEPEAVPAEAPSPLVCEVVFEEAVQPVSAAFVIASLGKAEEAGAQLFLVLADTPGGLGSSMDEIVDAFLAARVPVVFYVTPSGAWAASAGYIIGLSADIFAAAPGTSVGAASAMPLIPGGEDEKGAMETAMKKTNEIVAAQVRSMAEKRGRDPELAAKAIFDAKAWSAEEALEAGLVDIVAATREDLLTRLNGRAIRRFDGSEVVLDLDDYRIQRFEMSARQRALNLLANPNVAYILLLVGMFGILIEVYNPGMIAPGAVGIIALLLFAFSTQFLPINVVGVLLILVAVAFFVAEVKITSYGLLTLGGILCLILGGLMLIGDEAPDIPEFHVDPTLVVALAVTLGLLAAWGMSLAVRAHRAQVTTGSEGMVGEIGTAICDLDPKGRVYLHGEYWDARASSRVTEGSAVKVVGSRGLELRVDPAPSQEEPLPGGSRDQGE